MGDKKSQIETILRAEETLQTARHGYEDLIGENKSRRFTGLRNLIVFGRSVTFVLQNLRSVIELEFDSWYQAEQQKMRIDPLMRYFLKARNEIEKQGNLSLSTSVEIRSFSTSDLKRFGPPPPGATRFFIGDQLGGAGWVVNMPGGTTEKYYVELPEDVGEIRQHFVGSLEADAPELTGRSVEELSEMYLTRLKELLNTARERFLGKPPTLR